MKRFLFRLKKAVTLKKFLYFVSLITLPLASYLIGKGKNLQMENPNIVIDTSQVDCGCGEQIENDQTETVGETADDLRAESRNVGKTKVATKVDAGNNEESSLADVNSEQNQLEQSEQGQFVASKNGQKYYPFDCASANRIKEENRVYYGSVAEAEADGKELSSQCQ